MIIKGMNSDEILSDLKIDDNLIRKARAKVSKDITRNIKKTGNTDMCVMSIKSDITKNRYVVSASWYKGRPLTYYVAIANLFGIGDDFVISTKDTVTVITAHAMKRIQERIIPTNDIPDRDIRIATIIRKLFRPDMVYPMAMANDPSFLTEGVDGLVRSITNSKIDLMRCDGMFLVCDKIDGSMIIVKTVISISMVLDSGNKEIGKYLNTVFYYLNHDMIDMLKLSYEERERIFNTPYTDTSFIVNLFSGYQNKMKLNERNGGLDFRSLLKKIGSEAMAKIIYKNSRSIIKKFKL